MEDRIPQGHYVGGAGQVNSGTGEPGTSGIYVQGGVATTFGSLPQGSGSVGAVQKALSSFPRGSGAGPSGLRPLHLKEALAPGLRDEVLEHDVPGGADVAVEWRRLQR